MSWGGFRNAPHALFVAVGWLCLFSYLLVVGHYLLVEHSTCADHGELVHAGDGHAHDAPTTSEAKNVSGQVVSPLSDTDHEHDHCFVCADRREVPPGSGYSTPLLSSGEPRSVAASSPPSFVPASSVYGYAPKTSPPVRHC